MSVTGQPHSSWQHLSDQLRRFLDRLQPPDSVVLVSTAVVVGSGTALGAVFFIWLLAQIAALRVWLVSAVPGRPAEMVALLLVMGAAGTIVGLIIDRFAREAKGHGVPEVMEAMAMRNGRIRPRVAMSKVVASAITIGAGGSAGREGPIVQTGSALGSTIGQLLHQSDDRVRTLVACGGAAGIAATFNAPIAGTIFALEVILGRFTTRYFGAVVISAVSASVISRALLGDAPAFAVPAYVLNSLAELPIYILLGLLAAIVAVLFIRVLYWLEAAFDRWALPLPAKTATGMILTGLTAALLPGREVLGSGLEFIGGAIADDFSLALGTLFALLLLKLLATSFTLGAGNSGGVFAPSLFMGAVLGGMVGQVAQEFWPAVVLHPGAYALVGMASVFAGAARAPITAVLIVFEMSGDYKLILPLMMATVLSTFLAEHIFTESIYTLKLRLKGITLRQGRDIDLMQSMPVHEAMTPDPYVVAADMPLGELQRSFLVTHSHSFPVVDERHRLVGMVSISDLEQALEEQPKSGRVVADIATMGNILFAYEDEPLGEVMQRIAVRDINKMPVVSRQDPARVIGVIRRRDIIRAYNVALTRRMSDQESQSLPPRHVPEAEFIEIAIAPDSPAANRSLAEIARSLPRDCIIVSIRRHGSLLFPHGDTILQPGDLVSTFLRRTDEAEVQACLQGNPMPQADTT